MMATFIFCSRRAFIDVLESVALKFLFLSPTPLLRYSYVCNIIIGATFSEEFGANNFP